MTKAKHQGYSWWLNYVWNDLVRSASEFNTTSEKPRQVEAPPVEVVEAVAAARAELGRADVRVPDRQRAALLLVGHHLLDRVLRKRNLRVPCPERDLLLDTGLGDRKTVRAALARLNGRLGTLHTDCLSPVERDSTSYEFEINQAPEGEGRQIPPPAFDPPHTPRGLWATLPRSSHSLWRTLLTCSTPLELGDLAVTAGLVKAAGDEVSKSQRSTAKAALVALSKAGMVQVDENGRWQAATRPRSVQVEQDAAAAYARQLETIEAERAAYRAGTTSSWTAGRARAIKAQKAKERAWWDNFSPAARAERAAAKRLEFDQMSISQQAALKSRLAERRIRAGLDELGPTRPGYAASQPTSTSPAAWTASNAFTTSPPPNEAPPSPRGIATDSGTASPPSARHPRRRRAARGPDPTSSRQHYCPTGRRDAMQRSSSARATSRPTGRSSGLAARLSDSGQMWC